jgi:hypothetical protein
VAWSSSNTGVLTISSSQDHWGEGTIIAAGTSVIAAVLSGKTGTYNVTVTSAVPSSLEITPDGLSLPVGVSQQLSAIVTYSDGSKLDMTSAVTWSLVNDSDAATSGGTDANGTLNTTDEKGLV